MDEILKSLKAYLYDRAASPLTGAYITAWLVWNFDIVMIFFSDAVIRDKFLLADSHFSLASIGLAQAPLFFGGLVHGILIPAGITYLYLYQYPKLSIMVYKHSLEKKKELRIEKEKHSEEELITVPEAQKLRRDMRQQERDHTKEVESLQLEISDLREIRQELESQAKAKDSGAQTTNVDMPPEPETDLNMVDDTAEEPVLNSFEAKVLLKLNESSSMTMNRILAEFQLQPSKALVLTDRLLELGFVGEKGKHDEKNRRFILTNTGRHYLGINGYLDKEKPDSQAEDDSENEKVGVELDDREEQVLQIFSQFSTLNLDGVLGNFEFSLDEAGLVIDRLKQLGFIEIASQRIGKEPNYKLTASGQQYLTERGLE